MHFPLRARPTTICTIAVGLAITLNDKLGSKIDKLRRASLRNLKRLVTPREVARLWFRGIELDRPQGPIDTVLLMVALITGLFILLKSIMTIDATALGHMAFVAYAANGTRVFAAYPPFVLAYMGFWIIGGLAFAALFGRWPRIQQTLGYVALAPMAPLGTYFLPVLAGFMIALFAGICLTYGLARVTRAPLRRGLQKLTTQKRRHALAMAPVWIPGLAALAEDNA